MKETTFELAMSEMVQISNADKKHPFTTIAKFVFADDKPNQNNQAINADEFDSIAKSAIGMPVKIKFNGVGEEGHEGSVPIGVIRSMTKNTAEDGTNQLIAEAILWDDEYPDEINYLKNAYSEGSAPGISWELGFTGSSVDKGIEWLKDVITRAATFVKSPAYGPRTALLALASIREEDKFNKAMLAMAQEITKVKKKAKADMGEYPEDMTECSPQDALQAINEAIVLQNDDLDDDSDQQIMDLLTSARDILVTFMEGESMETDAAIDKNVGGGVDRNKIPAADFAGKNRSFPIVTPKDVADAAASIGRAGADNYSTDELKRRIIAIAKRKGTEFYAQLPESWKSKNSNSSDNEGGQEMEKELQDAKAALETAQTELTKRSQELAEKDTAIATKDEEITSLKGENQTLQEKIAELTKVNTTETRIREFTEAGLKFDADAEKAAKKRDFISSLSAAQWTEYLADKVADFKEAAKVKPDFSLASAAARNNFPKMTTDTPEDKTLKSVSDLRNAMKELAH